MGKNKKNKTMKDMFDISVEDQLAMLRGETPVFNNTDEDNDLAGDSNDNIADSIENAILEQMGITKTEETMTLEIEENFNENTSSVELTLEKHESKIDLEVNAEAKPSNIRFMRAKFSKGEKTLCISNNKQMFSICLDNFPTFDNDINNDINVITMVRNAVIKRMITCFEPTMMMDVVAFEDTVGTVIDSLGDNTHFFTYDDEDQVLAYELADDFIDAINDAIEVAIETGTFFPMCAALMDIPDNRYFRCDFDRLLKNKPDHTEYINYIMAKDSVQFTGENVNSSVAKFNPIDIEDIDDICDKAMQIVNRIMDKILGSDEDDEELESQGE